MTGNRKKALWVLGIAILWLFFEIHRWNDVSIFAYDRVARDVMEQFPFIGRLNPINGFARILKYMFGSGFTVFSYYLTVLIPERTHYLRDGKIYRKWVAVVLCVLAVCVVLSDESIYNAIIPGATNSNYVTSTLKFNVMQVSFLSGMVGLVLIVLTVEVPKALWDWKRLLKRTTWLRGVIRYSAAVGLGVLTAVMGLLILQLVGILLPQVDSYMNAAFGGDHFSWDAIVAAVLCGPILEEIAFRGLMLGNMKKTMPVWAALIISSLFFGIWHRNIGQFLYTSLMGIVWGLLAVYTGRIRYSMVSHMTCNYLATIAESSIGLLPSIRMVNKFCWFVEDLPIYGAILALVLAAAAIICLLWMTRRFAGFRPEEDVRRRSAESVV